MSGIENHMVALPQPELDCEPKCYHEYGYDVIDIQDYDESCITFIIKCQSCGRTGFVEGSIKIEEEPEWD